MSNPNLKDLLEHLNSSDIAFLGENISLSGLYLFAFTQKVLEKLEKRKLPANSQIIIVSDNSFYLLGFLIASWKLNLKPLIPNGMGQSSLEKAKNFAQVILSDDEKVVALFKEQNKDVISFSGTDFESLTLKNSYSDFLEELKILLENLTITHMTSGSTGTPKLITRTLASFILEAKKVCVKLEELFLLNKKTIVAATVPLFYAYGIEFRFILPLFKHLKFFMHMFKYEEQLTILNNFDLRTLLISSPAFLKRLSLSNILKGETLVLTAGGAINEKIINNVKTSLSDNLFEIFGSTETGVMACRKVESLHSHWTPPYGNSFYIVKEKINEDSYSVISDGEGVLALDSDYVDDSLKKNAQNLFGDKIRLFIGEDMVKLSYGNLTLLGRVGRVLKLEDKRLSLDSLEGQMIGHPFIKEVALISEKNSAIQYTKALMVLTNEGKKVLSSLTKGKFIIKLRVTLKQYIDPIAIPRKMIFVEELPTTENGKIAYKEVSRILNNEIS